MSNDPNDYEDILSGVDYPNKYSIDKNLLLYINEEGKIQDVQIGLYRNQYCVCSVLDYNNFNLRHTFFCDGCNTQHQFACSIQEVGELITNDHFRSEGNFNYCLSCKRREPFKWT